MRVTELTLDYDKTLILRICHAIEREDREEIVRICSLLAKEYELKDQARIERTPPGTPLWMLDVSCTEFVRRRMWRELEFALTVNADFDCEVEDTVDFERLRAQFKSGNEGGRFYGQVIGLMSVFDIKPEESSRFSNSIAQSESLILDLPKIIDRHPSGSVTRTVLVSFFTELIAISEYSALTITPGEKGNKSKMAEDIIDCICGAKAFKLVFNYSAASEDAVIWPLIFY